MQDAEFLQRLRAVLHQQQAQLAQSTGKDAQRLQRILDMLLVRWDSGQLIPQEEIVAKVPITGADPIRKARGYVETLRKYWQIPVLSKDKQPGGFWLPKRQTEVLDYLQRKLEVTKATFASALDTHYHVARAAFLPEDRSLYTEHELRYELRARGHPGLTFKSEARAVEAVAAYCKQFSVTVDDVGLIEFCQGRIMPLSARVVKRE